MNDKFYCYSKRMRYFIMSFGLRYIDFGVNKNTKAQYYVFEKSKKLDKIIDLYNSAKHSI